MAPIISAETIEGISCLSEAKELIRLQNEIIVRLDGEVRALREEVARLSKNSQTSSKPPSSDIVKPPTERRQKGKRRRGAQKGHKETQRALVPPEEVDHFLEVEVVQCSWCGSKRIAPLPEKMTRTIQRFELVEKPVSITEYHLHLGAVSMLQGSDPGSSASRSRTGLSVRSRTSSAHGIHEGSAWGLVH